MRYCGSKHPHEAHSWQQIGKKDGPKYECPGKKELYPTDGRGNPF